MLRSDPRSRLPFLYWSFISPRRKTTSFVAPSASLVSGMASGGHRRRNDVTGYNFGECCKSALPQREGERDELVDGVRGNQSTFPSSFGYFRVRLGRARVFSSPVSKLSLPSLLPSRLDDGACFSSKRASLLSTVPPLSPSPRSHSQRMPATFFLSPSPHRCQTRAASFSMV